MWQELIVNFIPSAHEIKLSRNPILFMGQTTQKNAFLTMHFVIVVRSLLNVVRSLLNVVRSL
jgi:hypothetical protein